MFDLHCHFLPGLDDGADTVEDALALARASVQQGVQHCVMTPHIQPGRFDNARANIEAAVAQFAAALQAAQVPLAVSAGAEVRLGLETLHMVQEGKVPYIGRNGSWNVMLLELPHSGIPVGSIQFVEKLLQLRVRPLIAHPERNKAVMHDRRLLQPFIAAGCWLQVTAASVVGEFGPAAHHTALALLDDDVVQVVASDAHNLQGRAPRMAAAREALVTRYGTATAEDLLLTRPRRIVQAGLQNLQPPAATAVAKVNTAAL